MDTVKKDHCLWKSWAAPYKYVIFNRSDESYDQCLKRLTIFAENSEAESVKYYIEFCMRFLIWVRIQKEIRIFRSWKIFILR